MTATAAPPQLTEQRVDHAPESGFAAGTPFTFTVAEYYRLAEQGFLSPDARVELIEGEILRKSPTGGVHVACVHRLFRLIDRQLDATATVFAQSPIRLGDLSEPESDIAVVRARSYGDDHPTPDDVFLLVEVSDSSLRFDRTRKLHVYAVAGIPEVWIVDVTGVTMTRYTNPNEGNYDLQERFRRGQSLTISALPTVSIAVDKILPAD